MTQVEVCNRALAVIGHDRTITSLADGTTEATLCSRFYPAARDNVLAACNWEFASIEDSISLSGTSTTWSIPSGFVKLVSVRDANGNVLAVRRSGASLLVANPSGLAGTAIARYVSNTPASGTIEAVYPHLVAEAVVYELASLLFGPMIGNVQDNDGKALFESYVNLAGSKLSAAMTAERTERAFMGGSRSADDEKKTEIANRAIATLGMETVVGDFATDPAPVAARIRLLYPSARDYVLSAHNWDFASVDQAVTVTGGSTTAWSIPAGFVRLVSVRDASGNAVPSVRGTTSFAISAPSGVSSVSVRYVSNSVSGLESALPSLVEDAVATRLAALLAGDMPAKDKDGNQLPAPDSEKALAAAIAADQAERAFMGGSRSADDEKKTEIANRAIAKLGGETVISDFATDPAPIAARARLLFPSSVERVLRLKDWDFAAVEQTAALTSPDADGYARYAKPTDCARLIMTMDERRHPVECVRNRDFLLVRSEGGKVIIRYVSRDFELSSAPDDFIDLLALDLADRLAPSVLRDAKSAAAVQSQLRVQFGEADMHEANETAFAGDWKNPFVAARM